MDVDAMPGPVQPWVDRARAEVAKVFGVEPDLTPETLPLVDGFLRTVVAQAEANDRQDLLFAVAAYFGEVARIRLHGRWAAAEDDPTAWRIELSSCFLHFSPLGMAAEALLGCDAIDYDGTFSTRDEVREELETMLEQAPPLAEDEYYSLSGRLEVLTLVTDWLTALRIASGEPVEPIAPEAYLPHP